MIGQKGISAPPQPGIHRQAQHNVDAKLRQGRSAQFCPEQVSEGTVPAVHTIHREPGTEHGFQHGDDAGGAIVIEELVPVVTMIRVGIGPEVGIESRDVLRSEVQPLFGDTAPSPDVVFKESSEGAWTQGINQLSLNEAGVKPVPEMEGAIIVHPVERRVGRQVHDADGGVAKGAVELVPGEQVRTLAWDASEKVRVGASGSGGNGTPCATRPPVQPKNRRETTKRCSAFTPARCDRKTAWPQDRTTKRAVALRTRRPVDHPAPET